MESLCTDYGVLLKNSQGCALFLPGSMQLFTLDLPRNASLADVPKWVGTQKCIVENIREQKGCDTDVLNLSYREALLPIITEQETLLDVGIRPKINRLTLNISNACNLFCSYCYADHGMYHSPTSYMSADRGVEIVERVLGLYGDVEVVHFFGGEPLLNPDAIDAIGNAFEAAYRAGRIEAMPQFVATTNGTISASRINDLLRKWQIELTVSWDGPKPIHDKMRPMSNSKLSSYDRLVKTLNRFRDNGISFGIECTYNIAHLDSGATIVDLMDFFHKNTGLTTFHITPASLPSPANTQDKHRQQVFRGNGLAIQVKSHLSLEKLTPLYRDAARETVRNMFAGKGPQLSFASSIVEQICKQRRSNIYCPAFFNQLSIAVDGTAYPCFMFIGDKRFRLGNILTDEFPTDQGRKVFRTYIEEFGLSAVGTNQWFAPLFGGCIAGEFISSNSLGVRTTESLYRAIIEECLLNVALYSDGGATIATFDRGHVC